MTTPQLPSRQAQEQRTKEAPSPRQAWTVTFITTFGFLVGGLGLVFGHDGVFYILYIGLGIFIVGCLYGWWVSIFEYTEEETMMFSSEMVQSVDPGTKPEQG